MLGLSNCSRVRPNASTSSRRPPAVATGNVQRQICRCRGSNAEDHGNSSNTDKPTQADQQLPNDSDSLIGSLSAVAKQGRSSGGRTNVILASDNSDDTWRKLDKRVNKYPSQRTFTAIGSGGPSFRQSMVSAVERIVGSVHCECVSERSSSSGNYVSVTVGPVWVENSD